MHGVDSRASLAGPVDVRCVDAALTSMPEAGRVTYQRREDRSTEIVPKRRTVLTVIHFWTYGEAGGDILQIDQSPDGWDYRNARSRIGVTVPHDEIERFIPLMQKVNRLLQASYGLPVGDLEPQLFGEKSLRSR